MAAPLATKKSEEVLGAVMEFVLRLRAAGFWVSQIHTDQGHEYYGPLKKWCLKRGIIVTRTPGDDPQGNGRAEVAIQGITQQMRAALLQAEVGWEWWPLAARHVAERLRSVRIGEEPHFPKFPGGGFGEEETLEERSPSRTDMREGEVPMSGMGSSWALGAERGQHQGGHSILLEEVDTGCDGGHMDCSGD